MSFWQPVHTFKIACGAGGAYVDVSSKIFYDQGGVVRSWGRQSSFQDFTGGTFSFTLDNRDGVFTPDSTVVGATPLSEGMYVTWQTDTTTFGSAPSRLISGKIAVGGGLQLIFPDPGTPGSARIRVTVSDMLVESGRHTPPYLFATALTMATKPYLYWPMNDAAGSIQAVEASGNNGPSMTLVTTTVDTASLGASGFAGLGETAGSINATVGTTAAGFNVGGGGITNVATPAYAPGSRGFMSLWCSVTVGIAVKADLLWGASGVGWQVELSTNQGVVTLFLILAGSSSSVNSGLTIPAGGTQIAVGVTYTLLAGTYTVTATPYVGNVAGTPIVSTTTTPPPSSISQMTMGTNSGSVGSALVAHFAHTPSLALESYAGVTTEANRLTAIDATTPELTLGTLPTDLSLASLGPAATSGQSVLDMLNDVMRTEQGQLSTSTAGSGTAPVQTVVVRARNRPNSVTATWVTTVDITETPDFERDLSNTVSEVDGTGAGVTAVATDAVLAAKVGSANASFNVLYNSTVDVFSAASDRLNRGRKYGVDVNSFVVDAQGLLTSRAVDLFALTLGDRHRVSGLPTAQYGGSATRDGWLLGVDETWTPVSGRFTLYLENCPPIPNLILGTDRWGAGTNHPLAAAVTSTSATSISISSVDGITFMETGSVPYDVVIDSERMTITACNSATPQVATVTRGVGGTTAATHAAGALLEIFQARTIGY